VKKITLADLAEKLGGVLDGDPKITVSGVAPLNLAGPDQISFLANPRYAPLLETSSAAGVIVSREVQAAGLNLIRLEDPYLGFAMAMELFYTEPYEAVGISDDAFVHQEALIGDDPSIHPLAVVCRGARIGSRVTVMPGAYVGPGVTVGDGTTIHPNVVLEKDVLVGSNVIIHAGTVVGSDGFGFAREGDRYKKIIHSGTVRIEDDVELGAGCTIDRAVMGETVIGQGSKLDNLIQVGHNVRIGPNCIIVAQVGIAGSAELQNNVTMAGQSGVAGHLKVGSGAVVLGKASVFKDVLPGEHVAGTPAIDAGDWRKSSAVFARLDDLRKRISRLEKELKKAGEGKREEEIS
jgi:UDP-3-O-[3-hydroxymyristoyl] glucosamine N-acyltransferase